MFKRLFALGCLFWILDPDASGQSAGRAGPVAVYSDNVIPENLCDPGVYDELYAEPAPIALDDDQLARLRIELLERGWRPGFDLDAVDADEQLADAIRGFQAESSLPVTGQPDATTLFLLGVPFETSSNWGS